MTDVEIETADRLLPGKAWETIGRRLAAAHWRDVR